MEKNSASISLTGEQEVEKVFNKFDCNGDGKISSTELRAMLNCLGSKISIDEVAQIMSDLDTDGDGFINLEEFKAFKCSGGNNNELKEAFDLYDQDKNGKISASELQAVLSSLGEKCSLDDCGGMISAVDVDGDGCVNFEEFEKMMAGPN